ncbi:MAG: hypothetical protein HDS68_01365 [Bacteroidales bacterium]|nr:hypothetical protein [Bacteroidales bacterium]
MRKRLDGEYFEAITPAKTCFPLFASYHYPAPLFYSRTCHPSPAPLPASHFSDPIVAILQLRGSTTRLYSSAVLPLHYYLPYTKR